MKRYITLSIIGLFAFLFLFIFYLKSESSLTKNHQRVLNIFLTAKQVEATLEKDLLKSRNFLLLTYDPIVENSKDVESICLDLRGSDSAMYKTIDSNLDLAIDSYCDSLEKKMQRVELFKSKNAILRNSIYYMQKISTEEIDNEYTKQTEDHFLRRKLMKLSLTYALVSSSETKEALQSAIDEFQKIPTHEEASGEEGLDVIGSHATRIYEIKEMLDSLTLEIVNSNSSQLLENIRKNYFQNYSRSEATAYIFRDILFIACSLFLGFIIYNIILLWRAAQNLTAANANLEQKVLDRTKELTQSQETIIQQQQVLISSAKLSSLGEMAGGVAHEINTPLAIIQMRTEQLEECITDGSMNPAEVVENLNVIKSTTKRIAKIIAGLRFFARDGKAMPTQEIMIAKILSDTLGFCQEKFANYGVQLETTSSFEPSLKIECRPVEISQVLLNLLNNSFDAVESLDEKWVRVGIVDQNEYIELTVTDSGSGIPKEFQDKIMQPFFTTKDIGKGTGLGLSISKGIIESHQGKISIDTESSNTRFIILLPKKQRTETLKESA